MNAPLVARRRVPAWMRLGSTALALLCTALAAPAQNVPLVSGTATVATGAANGMTGAIAINEAGGLDNAQGNQLTLGMGTLGAAGAGSVQHAATTARVGDTAARIEGTAFSNISGALAVNQAAGAGNLQRNSTVLGTLGARVTAVSDTELSEAAVKHGGGGLPADMPGKHEVSISNDAFKHINGIVQVNQTSGAGNATANSFVLRPPAGTFF